MLFSLANSGSSALTSHNPRLVITEVHPVIAADGSSAETEEWIEIHNLEQYPVNLGGWTIEDAQAIARLPNFELPARGTVLVVGGSSEFVVPAGKSLVILDSARIGTGLRDAGDRVALVDPYGVRADAVSWGDVRVPRFSDPPNAEQSIVRTASGGQALSDRLTPWTVEETVSATPSRYRHARPDTIVRISKALVDPRDGSSESVTIENISAEPLLTVNWSLTVSGASVKLHSTRIEAGESLVLTEPDGTIGSGLAASGGHLVLRDAKGNWLATASWGDDHSFHELASPSRGDEIDFHSHARVHPRIAWFESIDYERRQMVGSSDPFLSASAQVGSNISAVDARLRSGSGIRQESDEYSVWISEVYPTAGQGRNDPAFEWFELTTASDAPISLDGWTIADNTAADPLDGVILPPHSSVVIGVSSQAAVGVIAAIADGRIGNGLANAGDQLRLINPDGEVVSAVSWGTDRTFDSIRAPTAEESIRRPAPNHNPFLGPPSPGELRLPVDASAAIDPPADSQQGGILPTEAASLNPPTAESADSPSSASPAAAMLTGNSALRITEILSAPPAGQAEWVEIHNPTDQPIDLSGWSIGDRERQTELSGVIGPHSRLVISTQDLGLGQSGLVVERIGNGLNNDADVISLVAPSGGAVDEVRYGDDAIPAPGRGLSIALEPARWVVTSQSSPGSPDVTPLLGDALRSATPRTPVSDDGRLPVTQVVEDGGSNAWMIVSFALIGVILTLVVRRWKPDDESLEQSPDPVEYSGPQPAPTAIDEEQPADENAER